MSSLKYSRPFVAEVQPPAADAARRAAALVLRGAGAALYKLARRLAQPVAHARRDEPQWEFHAEAGAPEGALYLNGELVGWLSGVKRL